MRIFQSEMLLAAWPTEGWSYVYTLLFIYMKAYMTICMQ